MTDLAPALSRAFDYLSTQGVEVPNEIWVKTLQNGVLKAAGDLSAITAAYDTAITKALSSYLDGGALPSSKNAFKRATVEAFGGAFDLGTVDGGGTIPADPDALAWFNARMEAEFGYIDLLFQSTKDIRKDKDADADTWLQERVQGYVNTLGEIYNNAKLRAMTDIMVTFDGEDGAEPCESCKGLKGKRHKISWFVKRDYVPPHGSGLNCSKGGKCQHYLKDDKGNRVTI